MSEPKVFGENTLFNVYEFNWLLVKPLGTPGDKNDKTINPPSSVLVIAITRERTQKWLTASFFPFCMIMFRLYVHHASRCSSLKTEILTLSFGSEPDFSSCPLHLQTWCWTLQTCYTSCSSCISSVFTVSICLRCQFNCVCHQTLILGTTSLLTCYFHCSCIYSVLTSVFTDAGGAQWLSGRVLDLRPRGRRFKPHRRHCVVVLEAHLS